MIALEVWRLKQICNTHGLDHQEIDHELTYRENKEHLMSLAHVNSEDWRSQQEQYERENFLTYYVTCVMDGTTKSEEVGEPLEGFSLATYIQRAT